MSQDLETILLVLFCLQGQFLGMMVWKLRPMKEEQGSIKHEIIPEKALMTKKV